MGLSIPQADVVIIGGGLAGLAAAVSLAQAGMRITLLESRPRTGGRASSFLDKPTGEEIDNCQHIALGCCTNYLHFLGQISQSNSYTRTTEYRFIDELGQAYPLVSDPLTAPFHLVRSFLGLHFLSWRDRLSIGKGLLNLARLNPRYREDCSFSTWLVEQRQSVTAIKMFWEVVLVSALSESLERISLWHARKVFVDTFLRNRQGMEVIIPKIPLSVLYGEQVNQFLTSREGELHLQARVEEIVYDSTEHAISCVRLNNQQEVRGTYYLSAVPWYVLGHITSPELCEKIHFQRERWSEAPISSVHFWFDKEVIPVKQAVLLGRLSQWVFKRHSEVPSTDGHYYQVVISQSRALLKLSQAEIINQVQQELASIWPDINQSIVLRSRVVTEHKAVFSPLPGIDQFRPHQQTPIPNFFLAGDWTQTGWPATMEGAVRSGYLAAECILANKGQPKKILVDELPCSWWSSLLLGIN